MPTCSPAKWIWLFGTEVADGRLIQPFSTCVDTHDAYYLVSKKQGHSNERVARMYDWLMSEIVLFADKAEIDTDCS